MPLKNSNLHLPIYVYLMSTVGSCEKKPLHCYIGEEEMTVFLVSRIVTCKDFLYCLSSHLKVEFV